ncbi:protein phosphatase 1 regulatory subunit 3A [Ornithorhynchus anatinus]|uniref:Protein phosphatase 1 regulatory subunit 3A n=1 Tax=Ornithorhynchus anatinus TaxID=9258 RepID=F7GD98_ORNAN|nr:protein phosphatase 1 regulatory subunit 3A [Ornithorhynchus anatinus]
MESPEEPTQIRKPNLLEVPILSDSLSEDEDVKANFKPRFSPQPRRRGSDSSEDLYMEAPPSVARKVSFADAMGLDLVSVKEFDCWDVPIPAPNFELRNEILCRDEYILCPLFELPSSREDLMRQVQIQKAVLESTVFLPGITCMKGTIRVLNVSFEKLVYVRMSLDAWHTYYDILAEYVPDSCDGETDQFFFKISLVPPYQKEGATVEFCIRYETSVGTFWGNNNGGNYTLVCRKKEQEPEKPPETLPNKQIKGCLKTKSSKEETSETSEELNCDNSRMADPNQPDIIYSHEDNKDNGDSSQNVKDISGNQNDKGLEQLLNEPSGQTPSPPSRDERSTSAAEPPAFLDATGRSRNGHSPTGASPHLLMQPASPIPSAENLLGGESCHPGNNSASGEFSPSRSTEGAISDPINNGKQLLEGRLPSLRRVAGARKRVRVSFPGRPGGKTERATDGETLEQLAVGQNDVDSQQEAREIACEMIPLGSDKARQSRPHEVEVLDDNANPASGQAGAQASSLPSGSLLVGSFDCEKRGERSPTLEYHGMDFHEKLTICMGSLVEPSQRLEKEVVKVTQEKEVGNSKDQEKQDNQMDVSEWKSRSVLPMTPEEPGATQSHEKQAGIEGACDKLHPVRQGEGISSPANALGPPGEFHSPEIVLDNQEGGPNPQERGPFFCKEFAPKENPSLIPFPTNESSSRTDTPPLPAQRETSDGAILGDQMKVVGGNQSGNALESQGKAQEGVVNAAEWIRDQAGGEGGWGRGVNTKSWNTAPTEELFTCQETARCELSSVADHSITRKPEAAAAYIIKTASESTLEILPAGERAIIAQLPRETPLSDKPTEEKETAFDPHEGGNDGAHYPLCQREIVGGRNDAGSEKESRFGIYNAHRGEGTLCNTEQKPDRAGRDTGNVSPLGKSFEATGYGREATGEEEAHLRKFTKSQSHRHGNVDLNQPQRSTEKDALSWVFPHSDFNSEIEDESLISNQCGPGPSSFPSRDFPKVAAKHPVTGGVSGTGSPESGHDPRRARELPAVNKHAGPEVAADGESPRLGTLPTWKERASSSELGLCQAECSLGKTLGPLILISEASEDARETASETEGLRAYQPDGDQWKDHPSPDSASLPDQRHQDFSGDSSFLKHISTKILYFLLFLIFLLTTYYYDLMVGFAFYLFSLSCLYWEGGRRKESVKKK